MNSLSSEEVGKAIAAYLQHPNRVSRGAREEELLKVVEWASNLKNQTELNLEILKNLKEGTLVLDVDANGVVMLSNAS